MCSSVYTITKKDNKEIQERQFKKIAMKYLLLMNYINKSRNLRIKFRSLWCNSWRHDVAPDAVAVVYTAPEDNNKQMWVTVF